MNSDDLKTPPFETAGMHVPVPQLGPTARSDPRAAWRGPGAGLPRADAARSWARGAAGVGPFVAAAATASIVLGSLAAVAVRPVPHAIAQGSADWVAPYCGDQPRITSIFDHTAPGYRASNRDGDLRLYSGLDLYDCGCASYNASSRPVLYYDGHDGWDFALRAGVQGCINQQRPGIGRGLAYAAHGGQVESSRWVGNREDTNYGLHVVLNRLQAGERSLYGHLAAVFVDEGDPVSGGQLIGAVGTTGNSTGMHLHWAASRDGTPLQSLNTFDPYGWNRRYDAGYEHPKVTPVPSGPEVDYDDPHRGDGWSQRKVVPDTRSRPCPSGCGEHIVEEDQPCCTGWIKGNWVTRPGGSGGSYRTVNMSGSGTANASIRYFCLDCTPGTYLIEANVVGYGSESSRTHVARYEVKGNGTRVAGNPYSPTILDQHEAAHTGRWIAIGVFRFTTGFPNPPQIEINNRSDRYDFTESSGRVLVADALKFTRIDCGGTGSPNTISDN
jgi:hypothetical protein